MRRVAPFLLVAGLVVGGAPLAHAAPGGSDPTTAADDAAAWLAGQTTPGGYLPSPSDAHKADLSTTVQAVPALAAAGIGKSTVASMLAYLGKHVDDLVDNGGSDNAGALANLILAVEAAGLDPRSFGTPPTDLVHRLLATQRSDGLFGAGDPTFDGAFRQGLSLLALTAAGVANGAGSSWLVSQQCADGLWTAFRADTTVPCPVPDPKTFSGPDTNSTALAVLGLHAQGRAAPAVHGAGALVKVRTAGGGWGFLALSSQQTDADSTGLVLQALRTVNGVADAPGIRALRALQVGCSADAADRGGIAFQPGAGGVLVPNTLATVQAVPALAEVALPIVGATIAAGVPVPCATATTTVPVTVQAATSSTTSTTLAATGGTSEELPRTGSSTGRVLLGALVLGAAGLALAGAANRRRAR